MIIPGLSLFRLHRPPAAVYLFPFRPTTEGDLSMPARTPLFAPALTLLAAGAAAAKPPGLPADPHPNGKERTPAEREYHAPAGPATPLGFAPAWPGGGS